MPDCSEGKIMKSSFSRPAQQRLEAFCRTRHVVALDYDGTLAPIVPHILEAKIPASTAKLLRLLVKKRPVAIVSGRSFQDLASRMQIKGVILVGNHGFDWGKRSAQHRRFQEMTRLWKAPIVELAKEFPGVVIEDKQISLSIHYRLVKPAKREEFMRRFRRILSKLKNYRCVGGLFVFNLVPQGTPNKGDAVLKLMKTQRCERAVFVGDDVTDEDVFRIRNKSRIFDVRVKKSSKSRATYYMSRQRDMDRFLKMLLRFECG